MRYVLSVVCLFGAARAYGVHYAVGPELLRMCKGYLASPPAERAKLEKRLAAYRRPNEPVVQQLRDSEETHWSGQTGRIVKQHFSAPDLRDRHKDDLLYFYVPPEYDASKPFGLLIFMHGGGGGTAREYAQVVVNTPEDGASYHLRPAIDHASFITAGPSAPWDEKDDARWNRPEADDYITAVIRECRYRFNLDRDRVFLGGWSMGGLGAYHLCQRLSDRIAGGLLGAGCWSATNWRCMTGTPLFIIHGAQDAVAPGTSGKESRPRFTDVFFARAADQLLTRAGADHVYAEYAGGHHPREAGQRLAQFVAWARTRVRDPLYPHVVAMTPRGSDARSAPPAPHTRWVSILEIGEEQLSLDAVDHTGPGPQWGEDLASFNKQGLALSKAQARAGLVDARHLGHNVFEVQTENVTRFSRWLHPRMVDFSRPVVVVLNGVRRAYRVRPTLLDALRSYERRRDWGLIYHCEMRMGAR